MTDPETLFELGPKAVTLERLAPLVTKSVIADLFYFKVESWEKDPDVICRKITDGLGAGKLIVRSSALCEDSTTHSQAGRFLSIPNVDGGDPKRLIRAIERVVASYDGNPHDLVLVQPMIQKIVVSGVITTHDLRDGSPYYIFDYDDESGKTDTITSGSIVSKTLRIYREADFNLIESDRVRSWLEMVWELEAICGQCPLDIEFGQASDGTLYLFQARPIVVARNWNRAVLKRVATAQTHIHRFFRERSLPRPDVYGNRVILGIMPDWNPAEIIGVTPGHLAASLYGYLVTDEVWRTSRASMGYHHPAHQKLMVLIGGRPFIDVRCSFNSFLPVGLPPKTAEKLVNAWLERLDHHPELHDKVEFDIVPTVRDFNFHSCFSDRYHGLLSKTELAQYESALKNVTLRALLPNGTLDTALGSIQNLENSWKHTLFQGITLLDRAEALLRTGRDQGVFPFAVIARHAFIAEAFLRSAQQRGAWSGERFEAFKNSLVTVLSHMSNHFEAAFKDADLRPAFFERYGHLRPGTYDIQSPRYDQRKDLFQECFPGPVGTGADQPFELTSHEQANFRELLREYGYGEIEPGQLLDFARITAAGREHAKFIFTRNLSGALECFAQWGEAYDLSREDLSLISMYNLLKPLWNPVMEHSQSWFKKLADRAREELAFSRSLRLGYLIRDERDIDIIPVHRAEPNFITHQHIRGELVFLDSMVSHSRSLYGVIICIENADPGFDWIFTRGIAGLVTKFGGANSHMAIRCAELDLPAAIGCGEVIFERLKSAHMVDLDCNARQVRPEIAG